MTTVNVTEVTNTVEVSEVDHSTTIVEEVTKTLELISVGPQGPPGPAGPPGSGAGFDLVASSAVQLGDVLHLTSAGQVVPGDSSSLNDIIGISVDNYAPAATATVQLSGKISVRFAVAPAAVDNGKEVFASSVAGEASLSAPTTSGNSVIVVGKLSGADGLSTTPEVIVSIDLRADIP